ncbi:hypothetical protein ACIQPR_18280 [Streptomyces sp. NPDC091280]|uniref:hypothetical protein n=1 Tax=Streptomyces sp. NPDC091280 TaxID=3365984 RepID=UPI0037F37802
MSSCPLCPRTAPDGQHLCLVHSGELRGWLAEIPQQARLLEEFVAAAGRPAEGRLGGTGRAHAPLPVDLRVLVLLGPGHPVPGGPVDDDEDTTVPIRVLLGSWAGHIAYGYPSAGRDAYGTARTQPCDQAWPTYGETVPGWCRWLLAYLPFTLTLPVAGEYHRQVGDLVRRLRNLTHTTPQQHPRAAPCPACDLCTLVRTDGRWDIHCLNCGHKLTPDQYDEHAARYLALRQAEQPPTTKESDLSPVRTFDLAPVLAVTHHLPIEAQAFRAILRHLTGLDFDGPLAAAMYQPCCSAWLVEQHEQLRAIVRPAMAEEDHAAQDRWVADVAESLGTRTLDIAPLPPERLQPTDVFDYLADAGALHKTYVIS